MHEKIVLDLIYTDACLLFFKCLGLTTKFPWVFYRRRNCKDSKSLGILKIANENSCGVVSVLVDAEIFLRKVN